MSRSIYTQIHRQSPPALSESERQARAAEKQRLERTKWNPPPLPPACERLRNTSVAIVGGGLAGLAAARWLTRHSDAKVRLFEADKEFGGRVRSDESFSRGRITEGGAELLGSFHLLWQELSIEHGLTWIGRMDGDDYARAGLNVRLWLDKLLTQAEVEQVEKELRQRVLTPIAKLARQITDASRPWDQKVLQKFDNMSVAQALTIFGIKKDSRVWKLMELLVTNNYVTQIDQTNFLGLMCLVKGGQFTTKDAHLMGYWDELEIFRCADGCQALAREMARKINAEGNRPVNGPHLQLNTMVRSITIDRGVSIELVPVLNNTPNPGNSRREVFDFVIFAIPPSVWDKVTITPKHPKDPGEVGLMGWGPASKFFSNMTERFWTRERMAPNGGSVKLGMVWEGTDNQTRVGNQGIVLSVFSGGRQLTESQFRAGLTELYPNYEKNLVKKAPGLEPTMLVDWTTRPFIGCGYSAPKKGQIFTVGRKLSEPYLGRMFFAGEYTQMDSFGYMEGALRSGVRAANDVIRHACPVERKLPVRQAEAAAAGWASLAGEMESPFLDSSTTD